MSALLWRFSAVLFLLILWIDSIGAKEVRIVCYYTNWSVYRPGDAKFNPQNINPYLCTHLIYAFGGFTKENTLKPFDKYQDIEKGGYAKFVGLKTYNKNLKTLLAIGGWNEGSTRFSPMVANADRRKELVKNTIKFLRQNHFDGLDLDWEYPSFRDGGKSRDRDNYAQLVQELREEFERESEKTGRPRLLLTMAVPAGIEYIKKGYDVPKLTKYLDWMNILSYDYHSAYEPAVNHHSPLYPIEEESEYSYDIDLNIDYTIKHYIQSGADKSKLVLGIPTYGRSYTLYNPDANEIGSPADGPGEMGDATRENGYLAYYEICENIKSADWQVESPYPDTMGPYAYKDTQWVSYDDEDIARRKSEYVAEHGLGGIMFWSIDNDDFRGKCGDRAYPIIEAAKEALLKAYGLSDSNLLQATKKPIKSRTRSRTRGTTKALSTTETAVINNSGGRQTLRRKPHRISGKSEINTANRRRRPSSRKTTTTTTEGRLVGSSLLVTPSYTTPSPPSTPDSGGDFKCEDEGFFPHPKDCKKYFWCLSGPSELGIVAHQFTCPAGLYFNKAASSCDYTQNVLCNKKISKSSTKTTTAAPSSSTTTSTASSIFSTRRSSPKITAATSRTTFTSTTTGPEYEEEYEYYDEDEDDNLSKDAEEDPRVIKELIDLIKKAGGLDELEKQLKLQDEKQSTVNSGSTTQGSLSKSLFQRVLGRTTLKNTFSKTTPKYDVINRNSRGPQNDGIAKTNEEKTRPSKSRPQYTSIIRSRSSTVATTDIKEEHAKENNVKENTTEDTDLSNETNEDDIKRSRVPNRKSQPEYVTIRRQRISTTTAGVPEEETETGRSFSRSSFKQLGEDDDVIEDTEENDKIVRNTLRSPTTATPYVTIRRSRPTTTTTEAIDEQLDNGGTRKRGNGTLDNETITDPSSGFEYVTVSRQRPEVEPTTSKYVEIRTRGTTTAVPTTDSEPNNTETPPATTTIHFRSTTVTAEKEFTTLNVDEKILNESSSNNTNSQVDTLNLVEGNPTENVSNEVTENAKADEKKINVLGIANNDKISTTEKLDEQDITITTTIPTSNEESVTTKRKGPQAPRPAFHLRRTTVAPVTTTAETPTTPQTSKVSLTTPRNFFRKKGFGSRDLLINRNKVNKITDNSGNKENSVIDFETKAQYDDTNDDQYSSRKRFRNSISLEKVVDNSYEGDNNSKESTDNSEYKNRLRNRGRSRFTLQTTGTTASPRPRIRVVTDGPEEDYDTTEYIRKYRPDISYQIADLSSLTAVDLKDSSKGRRNGYGRRRRPTVQVIDSTTAASISTSTEPPLKTGSRTIPLARKFLENTSFDKNRRVRPTTANAPPTTQRTITFTTNNEGQATQKRYISRLKASLDHADIPNNASTQSLSSNIVTEAPTSKLLKFRKFTVNPGQSISTTEKLDTISLDNSSTTRKPLGNRRRKILRRLKQRPTTTTTELISSSSEYVRTTTSSTDSTERSITLETHNTSVTPAIEDNPNINIITKTELLDLNENQTVATTSASVSEDNINPQKDDTSNKDKNETENTINTTEIGEEKSKDDIDSKSNEEDDEEEGENIKLSESIVRENSQIGDFPNRNIINSFAKSGSKLTNSYRTGLSNDKVDSVKYSTRPVTEPNIIIRTRKIIRKLNPTETPDSDENGNKKVRKIVRRLRPSTFPLNQIDSEKTQERENTGGYSARRRFGFNKQSSPTTEATNDKEDNNDTASSKPLLSKRRYNQLNRKGTTENIEKSKSGGLKIEKGINKSIYSRIRTTTTTTTTTTEAPTTTARLTSDNDDELTLSTTDSSTSSNYEITESHYEESSTDISTEGASDNKDNEKTIDLTTQNTILTNTAELTSSVNDNRNTGNTEDFVSSTQQEYGITNTLEESDKNHTTTIVENSEYTNDIKSTTPLTNIVTEEDTTLTFIDESSLLTSTEEPITPYEEDNLTNMNASTDEITASIVKTTTTLPTTKRIVSTTESPLSKLLKRRRFGSNTNPSESQDGGQNEDAESREKGRFPSLNTRLRLRKFGKSTTEGSLTEDIINESEGGKYTTQELHEGISLESTSGRVTPGENTDTPTMSYIDDETNTYSTEYPTASVEAETVVSADTTFDSEKISTSTETFTAEKNEENVPEITNTDISDVTIPTVESMPKENISITETLSIPSTEAAISGDTSTSSDPTLTANTTVTDFTTDKEGDTESTTEIITEAIITSTTTRRPNRLFRPVDARPKYTVKYRPSESTSAVPSTSDSNIKSYSRYKLRTRNRNRFTFSSTTERYDENEELGYGPVKEFKSTLRINSKIRGRDEFYESRKIEEEEYTDDNEEESFNVSDEGEADKYEDGKDEDEGIANIRSSIYNRPYPYKPVNPVIQKPATFTKTDEKEYDDFDVNRHEENVDDHVGDDEDDVEETNLYRPQSAVSPITRASNAPIGVVSQKPVTKTYKGFRSTTSASVVQDLSDINITAINERNRNLFTKTRKQNVPVAYLGNPDHNKKANNVTQNISQFDYFGNNGTHLSNNGSTYNTPYYQPNLYSSTESLYAENVSFSDNITSEHNLLQSESDMLVTTEAVTTLTFDTSKVDDITEEVKSTETTQVSTTLLLLNNTKEKGTTQNFKLTEIADTLPTLLPLNTTNENDTVEELKSTPITEKSSTLLHIFAETEAPITETTMSSNGTDASRKSNKKLEKLIEINRVIEVHAEEGSKTVIKEPIVDKIGLVSRITEIKIVEDKNSTSNQSAAPSGQQLSREEKKYESKTDYNFNIPIVSSSDITQINQIHIDSGSAVNKITPKPFYKAETSTIPLEGLFQTDSPLKYHHNLKSDSPNEILEGEHSRFVNVRILEQDITDRNAKLNHEAKFVPIKLLRDEDEITMKADVVEVTPESKHRTIKIAPIKVMLEGNV